MKKKLKIENLCCAHCASKIEEKINKLDGVEDATINFIMGKIIINCDDDKVDSIVEQTVEICKNIEPDAKIVL